MQGGSDVGLGRGGESSWRAGASVPGAQASRPGAGKGGSAAGCRGAGRGRHDGRVAGAPGGACEREKGRREKGKLEGCGGLGEARAASAGGRRLGKKPKPSHLIPCRKNP